MDEYDKTPDVNVRAVFVATKAAIAMQYHNDPVDTASRVGWLARPEARPVTGAEFTIGGGTNV